MTRIAFLVLLFVALPLQDQEGRRRPGYTSSASTAVRGLEQRFQSMVSATSISQLHGPLAARPHPAGTDASAAIVEYLQRILSEAGLEVETTEYQVLLSSPRRVEVMLTAPQRLPLSVREPAISADPTSGHAELREGYVAYSASGVAEGPVVYVNYGLPADYRELDRQRVSVKDRIVIARYGRSHRAVKVHTAQQQGAKALILYSDPADDGIARGEVWPPGYWRGEQMLQRGNAKFSWFWHGDPLTPGVAALPDATRLDPATAPTLPKIPVVVLSWGVAKQILSSLDGPIGHPSFHGGLQLTYQVGPGPASVRISVDMDQRLRPIRNVIGRIRGSMTPERAILLGGHHDAWTFGAVDPGTGTAALLEVAKGLGELARSGWRPQRTISLAFWDAEEYGLIGSTEYAEHKRAQLQEQLVMYVNTDMNMAGRFDPGGVPSLREFVADVTRDVPDATTTVYDGWRQSEWQRLPAQRRPAEQRTFNPDLKPLGSGADFVPFQDHLGVPTLSIEFIGVNGYGFGTYHTNYDSRAYVERTADPGFVKGATLARVLGTLALRMSHAEVLPFRFSHYAAKIREAIDGLQTDGLVLDLTTLRLRAQAAAKAAAALEQAIDSGLANGRLPNSSTPALNDRLARLEQQLADDDAAADTKWYRHVFYGWNIYSLYDGQPFPGLVEAVRLRDSSRAAREIGRIERALDRMAQELNTALSLAAGGGY